MATTHDLTKESGVRAYLSSTPFNPTSVEVLSGGSANFTWRLHLATPFEGRPSVVLKHTEGYVASMPTFKLSVERFTFEHLAVTAMSHAPFLESTPLVKVPAIFFHDADNHIIIYEDAGSLPSVKTFIASDSRASAELAKEIGSYLGTFLGNMHKWGAEKINTLAEFSRNQVARQVCGWRTAGRLVEIAEKFQQPDDVWGTVATSMIKVEAESEETFIMGDFWTGNVLVDIAESASSGNHTVKRLWIVDWELARLGPAYADIGQFAAESWLLTHFHPSPAASSLLSSFFRSYRGAIEASKLDIKAGQVAQQMGAHVAVFGGSIPWGSEDETRKAVRKGLDLVKKGWNEGLEWGTLSSY